MGNSLPHESEMVGSGPFIAPFGSLWILWMKIDGFLKSTNFWGFTKSIMYPKVHHISSRTSFLRGEKYRNSPNLHPVSNKNRWVFGLKTPGKSTTFLRPPSLWPVGSWPRFRSPYREPGPFIRQRARANWVSYTSAKTNMFQWKKCPHFFNRKYMYSNDWFSVVMLICQSVYTNYGLRCSPTR